MKTTLTTAPTFTFIQGDVFEGAEMPIQVQYYNGGDEPMIELVQEDRYINFTNIEQLKKFVKEVVKNYSEAKKSLDK